jgi:hypothetical protein
VSVFADRELTELLRDRPDLAAVADAVSETQRPRRKWLRATKSRGAAFAAVLAAIAALALVAPWQSGGPTVVERALAAVGGGPVIHAVVEYSQPGDEIVDIRTGEGRQRVRTTEYWYDQERHVLRTRVLTDDVQLTEILETPDHAWSDVGDFPTDGSFTLDPALGGFVTQYRESLAAGRAIDAGESVLAGRKVKLLHFRGPTGEVREVAVDAETGKPLRFHTTYPGGRTSPTFRVVRIESVARDPRDFQRPKLSPPRGTSGSVSAGHEISLADAAGALGRTPVWLGREFTGQRLESVRVERARVQLTNGGEVEGTILRIEYEHGARVSQALDPAGRYALGIDDGGDPVPLEGSLATVSDQFSNWQAELRVGRLAVVLDAASRERLLQAARELRPLGQ